MWFLGTKPRLSDLAGGTHARELPAQATDIPFLKWFGGLCCLIRASQEVRVKCWPLRTFSCVVLILILKWIYFVGLQYIQEQQFSPTGLFFLFVLTDQLENYWSLLHI